MVTPVSYTHLGDWNPDKAALMSDIDFPEWQVEVDAGKISFYLPFGDVYKRQIFTGVLDDDEGIILPKNVVSGHIIKNVDEHGNKRYDLDVYERQKPLYDKVLDKCKTPYIRSILIVTDK